ncbi:DNA-3-methyladenine glycosylase 2 family protein [Terrimonas sp. NA20]|uniref:DNA-3-methyladenine glycosylase II n=1 Tax=Terrimonas ginsenosidimutans TaxID=2908004 RepID=A0ABS9KRT8_9BACT|nr:DNA-3-methyladenine glycosylase 2 family protein [Terrimonas ginsenosidimutans]MCG2615036.1 DNA-3-methyladenine glycosylase 2 family protein [Terrimonas ginsenosidimutans]
MIREHAGFNSTAQAWALTLLINKIDIVKSGIEKKSGVPETFSSENFQTICDRLGRKDKALRQVLQAHGYPPMWTRKNNFETLVHIILEQQVSLASALAALNKLKEKIKRITPSRVLDLTDEEMRACYVSRQKMVYIRGLAESIRKGHTDLKKLSKQSNEKVREELIVLKGIGNWTIDVYLMFALQRTDLFPIGDLAAVNALKRVKNLAKDTSREDMLKVSEGWAPFRTVATMILWHYYLSNTGKKIAPVE